MQNGGRRAAWGFEIKRLFGADLFSHVLYYDLVGTNISGKLQKVVITDTHLYIFDFNIAKMPEPFCKLTEIQNLDSDHESPEAYRGHQDYDPHHIFFNYKVRQYHLYTFEPGTDLFWMMVNAVENANRFYDIKQTGKAISDANLINLKLYNGKLIPLFSYYVEKFNKIQSHIVHASSHQKRMSYFKELAEVSKKYYAVRIIFFQSSVLVNYLISTLHFMGDYHTIPPQVKINRLEQVELLKEIYSLFSFYLEGQASVQEAFRLIIDNNSQQYRYFLQSIFDCEWFILSQPQRVRFYLNGINNIDNYLSILQEIESISVSLMYQLYSLSIYTWRTTRMSTDKDLFIHIIQEHEEQVINGAFHTIVYTLIQMCYAMENLKVNSPFCHSIYDHLWIIDFFTNHFQSAAHLIRDEFASEFDVVVTEHRIRKCIPDTFLLLTNTINCLNNIRATVKKLPRKVDMEIKRLPVQFR